MAVADIFIRIVTKGAELANKQMDRLGGGLTKVSKVAKLAGIAFATTLAVGISKAVKQFVEFEDALNQSLAIMNTTIAQQHAMADAAREVAISTRISSTEAAESFFFLASAGLDATQSIAALPQVAAFAQAGMFDMSLATDLATDAQSALGLTVSDAQKNLENLTRVTDVLVKANTLANASVQQFSEALTTKAGAALKVVNKDIEEGVAVLAAFADRGVKGAEAGDKLNQVLRDIPRATAKNSEEFAKLGLNMFDTEGNMKNVADIVEELDAVLGPMSDELKASTLDQLGLNRGVADAVKILSGAGDQIREYEKALRDSGGTTQEVADKQIASLAGQAEILRDKFAVAGELLIEDFAPALEDTIGFLNTLLDIFIRFSKEDDLPETIEESTKKLVILNAALGGGVGVIANYQGATNDLERALSEQRLGKQMQNMVINQRAIQDSIDNSMPSFIDARRNAERYAVDQDMLAVSLMDTTKQVEEQTDAVTELSDEMLDNQLSALSAMLDAEQNYQDILKENERLLDKRKKADENVTEVEGRLQRQKEKITGIEEKLTDARKNATLITDEEKLAILRQEAAVQRLVEIEDKSELQKQELIVAEKQLGQLRQEAIGEDREVIRLKNELEQAEKEQIRLLNDLKDAQERYNQANKEFQELKQPQHLLRIAEAKRELDKAISDVKAFDNLRAALDSIAKSTGQTLADIYKDIMAVMNMKPPTATTGGGGGTSPPIIPPVSPSSAPVIPTETTATQRVLSDSRFNGGSGVTTILNIQNNIQGEFNPDDVAIKVIEAQKRGLKVIL
jgi:TP901 family phage tail tape measure protein